MKKFQLLVTTISLVVAALLIACGQQSGGATPGVTDSSVKVGNSIAVSGPLAPVGVPFKSGIEAYFMMVNEGGGVNGRKIDYVHRDDEFDPVKGKAALDWLVSDQQVFALVGHFGTPVVGATLTDIKEAQVPAVYFATGTGILFNENATGNDRYAYPVQPVYPMEGRILAAWAIGEFNAKKIGVIYTNDDAGKDLLTGINSHAEAESITVVAEQVPPSAEDVSSAVTKIKSEQVDVVIIAAIQGTFPQIAKELAKQGSQAPILTTYVNTSIEMTQAVDSAVSGQFPIYANAWVDFSKPAISDYRNWVAKVSSENFASNAYAMTGWIAAHFFVEGLKRVETELTRASYMEALESMPISNPFGGQIDFADGKRLGTQQMALHKMDISSESGWTEYIGFKGINEIMQQ